MVVEKGELVFSERWRGGEEETMAFGLF